MNRASKIVNLFVLTMLSALLGACSSTQQIRDAELQKPVQSSPLTSDATSKQIAEFAQRLVGYPYVYGGSTPAGFDCSGLVYYIHQNLGLSVPRTAEDQHRASRPLKRGPHKGDLVFFKINGSISHVGIAIDHNRFIHAPKSGGVVSYESLDEPYWKKRLVKVAQLH